MTYEFKKNVEKVPVTVPISTTVNQGDIVLLDGRVGIYDGAVNVVNDGATTALIAIDVSQNKIWRTDQIDASAFATLGAKVYWDNVAKKLTETATSNTLVGRVTAVKSGTVIEFQGTDL